MAAAGVTETFLLVIFNDSLIQTLFLSIYTPDTKTS